MDGIERIDRRIQHIRTADMLFKRAVLLILLLAGIYTAGTIYDMHALTRSGIDGIEFHDFEELRHINPDIAAWIRMDNTNIDHPVVKGEDNFEYLSLDFYRNDYAGGCIFLDENNRKDLSDSFIIIHGHHMAGGAMFGDLTKYLDRGFFDENMTGELLMPERRYELTVFGAADVDAYESGIYYLPADCQNLTEVRELAELKRDIQFAAEDKIVVLSTCSGSMDNMRTVVFLRAREEGGKN